MVPPCTPISWARTALGAFRYTCTMQLLIHPGGITLEASCNSFLRPHCVVYLDFYILGSTSDGVMTDMETMLTTRQKLQGFTVVNCCVFSAEFSF
jgi:hypothetical protein